MAFHPFSFFGHTPPLGMSTNRNLPVILNSPQHQYALSRMGQAAGPINRAVAALGSDGGGLKLNIARVQRPK